MKKFLGFYLPLVIAVNAGGFFTGSYLVNNHAVILKSVLGFGKIIPSSKQTIIKADGFEVENAKIFETDE